MANIMINNNCNLSCEYCFAKNISAPLYMTFTDFKYAVDFIARGKEQIGILGGEPTIHPLFREFVNYLEFNKDVRSFILFTNGINLGNYVELIKYNKMRILLNLNRPSDIGRKYDRIIEGLCKLRSIGKLSNKIAIGLTIYDDKYSDHWLKVMKDNSLNKLRLSIAVPNKRIESSSIEYYKKYKQIIFKYVHEALNNGILPFFDCNVPPPCILENSERQELMDKFSGRPTNVICNKSVCEPVIDILPDLKVIRCFGTKKDTELNLKNFKSLHEIRNYYINEYDKKLIEKHIDSRCKKCVFFQKSLCNSGCLWLIKSE
ncbi:radical SAM protein [Petrotoga olearia]|uniref:Radical SAM core domain-containing protein n=2 Tax=Petrotoga olearia TaxID=156203 RepID=A0A2K1P184_9BACT|nr:radical SAM protein [Petrotoga olearia]PNR96531.1 hypothetical protein X929_04205 [Petrotoga olearia DSM 13574]RMA76637.1 sulfatase maturation enzyme AslB (radical SAM superfamily) [Petrotoga olearia]